MKQPYSHYTKNERNNATFLRKIDEIIRLSRVTYEPTTGEDSADYIKLGAVKAVRLG